jgi:hypothetical protein
LAALTEVRAELPKIDDLLWDKITPLKLFLVTEAFMSRSRPGQAYTVLKKHDGDKE